MRLLPVDVESAVTNEPEQRHPDAPQPAPPRGSKVRPRLPGRESRPSGASAQLEARASAHQHHGVHTRQPIFQQLRANDLVHRVMAAQRPRRSKCNRRGGEERRGVEPAGDVEQRWLRATSAAPDDKTYTSGPAERQPSGQSPERSIEVFHRRRSSTSYRMALEPAHVDRDTHPQLDANDIPQVPGAHRRPAMRDPAMSRAEQQCPRSRDTRPRDPIVPGVRMVIERLRRVR